MGSIFLVQDNISKAVLTALQVNLMESEQAIVWARSTDNLDAYIKYLQAYRHFRSFTKENMILTRKGMQKAIELDSNYEAPYVVIGSSYMIDFWSGWGESKKISMEKAQQYLQKAIALSPDSDLSYACIGHLYLIQRQFDKAIETGERAMYINPNGDLNLVLLGITYSFTRRYDEAIRLFDRAQRLNPEGPAWYFHNAARAYSLIGRWDDAIAMCKMALDGNPNHYHALYWMAVAYGMSGQIEKGRAVVSQTLKISPNVALTDGPGGFKYEADMEMVRNGLRKVGFPDKTSTKKLEKPSIAVLPFVNMSNDPEQEYFSDGMTDELISDLAKINDIFVISRNSAFTYKGKSIKVQQIAKDLNVRYILEGSVQRSGNKVRIRAQLIDGKTDHHLWSESYDGTMDDIFELQDKITGKIVSALAIKLTEDEQDKISDKGTDNILAYEAFLKGYEHYTKFTAENLQKAIEYYKQAIQLDPKFSRAYSALALGYYMLSAWSFPKELDISPPEVGTLRFKARQNLDLSMQNPTFDSYRLASFMAAHRRKFDDVIVFADKSLLMAPNEYLANLAMGHALNWLGRGKEALAYIDKAIQLDPRFLDVNLGEQGVAYFLLEDYEKAVESIHRCLTLNPGLTNFAAYAAASFAFLDRIKEAENAWKIFVEGLQKEIVPTTEFFYYAFPFEDTKIFDHLVNGLIKAGFDGDPSDYHKVNKENRLSGQAIRELLFGKTALGLIVGFEMYTHRSDTGKLEMSIPMFGISDMGESWIEGDMVCNQFDNTYDGVKFCQDVYSNPEGNYKDKDQYLQVSDAIIFSFSIKE